MIWRPPTAIQLAQAAEIVKRFAATHDLNDAEYTQILNTAHMMGMAALAMEEEE